MIYRQCIACVEPAIHGTSRCARHSRGWRKTPEMIARGEFYKSPQWKARSKRQLEIEPNCRRCGAKATIADHIEERGLGGADDGPLQSLCRDCHFRKSSSAGGKAAKAKREAQRREGQ